MSDEWNDEVEEAPRKKKGGLPAWFWWTCGVGCLLVIVMVAVIAFFAVMVGQKIADPEYAKAKLADVLPSDEWPESYSANGLDLFGAFGEYAVHAHGFLYHLFATDVQRSPLVKFVRIHLQDS